MSEQKKTTRVSIEVAENGFIVRQQLGELIMLTYAYRTVEEVVEFLRSVWVKK